MGVGGGETQKLGHKRAGSDGEGGPEPADPEDKSGASAGGG